MSILFEAPVAYPARVRARQKRNHQDTTLLTSIPVRVAEVSAGDAPIVMRSCEQGCEQEQVVYRRFGDHLVRAYRVNTEGGHSRPIRGDELEARIAAFTHKVRTSGDQKVQWRFESSMVKTSNVTQRDDWQQVVQGDPAQAIAATRRLWSEACIVDGDVYVSSQGPCWYLNSAIVVNGQPYKGARADLPPGARRVPLLTMFNERGYVRAPEWASAPDCLVDAGIRMRSGLDHQTLARLKLVLDWTGKYGPTQGSIWVGEQRIDATTPLEVGPRQIELAVQGMLGVELPPLSALSPSLLRTYADLKSVHQAGIDKGGQAEAELLLRRFHMDWQRVRQTRYLHGDRNLPIAHSDPCEPLWSHLGLQPSAATPVPVEPSTPANHAFADQPATRAP